MVRYRFKNSSQFIYDNSRNICPECSYWCRRMVTQLAGSDKSDMYDIMSYWRIQRQIWIRGRHIGLGQETELDKSVWHLH